ncbi:MAG TPA: hypothetical protein VEI25_21070 [Paraburkholderia sp.]|nr:hypothetical protein [Paraburkholderia sp.]
MTIKRAEFLVLVALVTSAAVAQLRESTLASAPQPPVQQGEQAPQPTLCGESPQGVAPAGCEVKPDDERRVDGAQQRHHHDPRLWV